MNSKGAKKRMGKRVAVRRCQYCVYWEAVESHGDTPYMKTCHRYPPQVYSWGQTRMHEQPKTHPASWCGEFVCRFPNAERSDPAQKGAA